MIPEHSSYERLMILRDDTKFVDSTFVSLKNSSLRVLFLQRVVSPRRNFQIILENPKIQLAP